jgi:GAF domain/ANTAR domain
MDRVVLSALLAGLARDRHDGTMFGRRLSAACVDVVGVTGAGIMVMIDEQNLASFANSDRVSGVVEELQFTLGEGPCIDAYQTGRPVLERDLKHPAVSRWPAFSHAALDAGVSAIFSFPLQVGAVRLGALDLYCDHPEDLDRDQLSDALVLAGLITHELLALQAGAEPGVLGTGLEDVTNLRAAVHQASGMVSEQLQIPVGDALVRLRAYAYAGGRPINDVARDVVARRLRLD